jgi:uncharacterized protein (TIGR02145 family)
MPRITLFLLLFAFAALGQQERIAILQTVDDRDSIGFSELAYLTDRFRETAVNVLPKQRYGVMTTESIVAFLGSQERAAKECRAASCLAELGRKVNADYVAQARIGRFNKSLTIKAELYSSKSGNLLGSFTGDSKSLQGLLAILDEKAPDLFKKMFMTSEIPIIMYENSERIPNTQGGKFLMDYRDGKTYRPVQIGKQTWMAENLNYAANGSKCYDNKPTNCDKYGRLYDWQTAMKACPNGWHLPSNYDWDKLMRYLDGVSGSGHYDSHTAGRYLKAIDGWSSGGNGQDTYGFSALPGGNGYSNGNFYDAGYYGRWWSASEGNSDYAYIRSMGYGSDGAGWYDSSKDDLFSVRCLQD